MNPDEERHVCRCEEVSEREIREAVKAGARTVTEIKRWTRAGMGICQGRSCRRLVERILCEELGVSPATLEPPTTRPPIRPVSIRAVCREEE
ncbi:MAG: (2Fe-2S)-binding protein [Spirochaetes bacterium]|nr:(2Fe-2S)-binding protein [Spirochaetota bacterium]MBU1080596.1 (2Fe-2S)-binding protein [Spirochaetota bacterium]